MNTIALTIDGKKITCPTGASVLEAADRQGIKIPRLCHHPDLKPYGACRMCLVEDETSGRLMAACVTPAAAGMAIQTATERIIRHRRNIVRLMMAEHPESCIVCAKGNRCQLRQVAAHLGIGETDLYPMPNHKPFEEANPFMIRDLSKCILCGKCIRADHELVQVGAIDYNMRGFASRPATVHEQRLEQSSCTFCGTCLSLCPTGALSLKNMRYVGSPEQEAESICGFCGVGCRLTMGSVNGRIVEVNPAHQSNSVNGATLCVRGHFAHDFLNSSRRLLRPMLVKEGEDGAKPVRATWEEALDFVADRLKAIKERHGPQSIGFMGSSKCTLEENYLFQKVARVCLHTNNVDSGGRIHGQGLTRHLDEQTGGGHRISRLADLQKADLIMVLGADPSHSVPVAAYYLKRAARSGIPLIVVDPRRIELVDFARAWLPVAPGGDTALLTGMAALLMEKGTVDHPFIERGTQGFGAFQKTVAAMNVDDLCRRADVAPAAMERFADLLAGKKIAFVVGHGILQQPDGQNVLDAILNLALISGSLGCKGAGIVTLAKENNPQGALDMGAAPDLLPGRQPLENREIRRAWEQQWKSDISADTGLTLTDMIVAAEKGELKALYIMGENPLAALPERGRVQKALARLDLIVVQDILKSALSAMAHVILPGAAMAEKQGAFTNLEGRIQSFQAVVDPPNKAMADWKILARLYARFNGAAYDALGQIREEIQQTVAMYAAFNGQDEAWIEPAAPKAVFSGREDDARMAFGPVVLNHTRPPEKNYPFTAIVGTQRYHLGCGTRTSASERIEAFEDQGHIEIAPADAAARDLKEGDRVVIRSTWGEVSRCLKITSDLKEGYLFVPTGANANDAMNLFCLDQGPGWKSCAVTIVTA